MIARLSNSSIFGLPPASTRPKALNITPAATLSLNTSSDVLLDQGTRLGPSAGYESDHSDHDNLYRAATPDSPLRASDRTRDHRNIDDGDTVRNLAGEARPRPNTAARRSPEDVSSSVVRENTGLSEIRQEPDPQANEIVEQRKVQQQHEAKGWKTWEESSMDDCFALFTPKGLRRQVSRRPTKVSDIVIKPNH